MIVEMSNIIIEKTTPFLYIFSIIFYLSLNIKICRSYYWRTKFKVFHFRKYNLLI
jgi:hypothetical protein